MSNHTNSFRTFISLVLISIISLALIGCGSKNKKTSYMLSTVAKQATVKKTNFNYELIIKKRDISSVVVFADRPKRNVNNITVADLKSLWLKDQKKFKKNPPHAVLSGKTYPTTVVEVTGMVVHSDDVHFQIKSMNGKTIKPVKNIQNVVLTIDNSSKKKS